MRHPSSPRTVLVLGAAGRLGSAAVEAFAAAGWRVIAQARRSGAPQPRGVHPLAARLDEVDRICTQAQAAGASAVVHAVNPPYTAWPAQALPLLRQGMAIAERLDARLMLPGNVYNFGASMPARLQEATPQRASTRKGRIRVEMEAELEARAGSGLRSLVLRAGDFFGAGQGTWLDLAIAKSIARGRLVYPGPLDVPHAWAYLPDLARAFVALAERDDVIAPFARYHFPGHTLTGRQLLDGLQHACATLGCSPARGFRVGGMPWRAIRVLGLVMPMPREIAEMAYLWRVPHALDGSALRALLGTLPATPLDEALVQALRAQGLGCQAGRPEAARPAVRIS